MKRKLLTCEICGYKAKQDVTIVQPSKDGIIRCRVCHDKVRYGFYASDKYLIDNPIPGELQEWSEYVEMLDTGG